MEDASEDADKGQESEEEDEDSDVEVVEMGGKVGGRVDGVGRGLYNGNQVVPKLGVNGDIFSGLDISREAAECGEPFGYICGNCLSSMDILEELICFLSIRYEMGVLD